MELEGGHRNSVIKRRNPIEFGLVCFVLTSTLILYGNQRLMMELEGGHRNSVIKRRNPIEFGLVEVILLLVRLDESEFVSCARTNDMMKLATE
ncbi:hypothetical protein EVAR_22404_1 [Eumeta japonica]|uniref:Uncharacterized protein n=1 Tax=Eumeta variegata TaxID=151549 RepID=A0A4C1VLW4_EUMVA|nr:hypothetical protein EVAR_22404_1 [Eumeta japonica]